MLSPARPPEIIRSSQKDEYYQHLLHGTLTDIVQSLCGPHIWIRWRRELELLADVMYLGLTTFASYQTLGEEYVNILMVDHTLQSLPSKWDRGGMILLQVVAPYVIDRVLSYAEIQLSYNPLILLPPAVKTWLLAALPTVRHAILVLHRCHLVAFYLHGIFYHIAKRLKSIRYVLVRSGSDVDRGGFHILGWLSIIQLTLTFIQQIYKVTKARERKQHSADNKDADDSSASMRTSSLAAAGSSQCSLCLETRKHSTVTPCGHVFCWQCITEWCSSQPRCPLCREQFHISRLIYLQNFDPT